MNLQIILIDNDLLIRKSWEMAAEKSGHTLTTFSNVDDFIAISDKFPKETLIYIDYELDDGVKGDIEAARISEIGFKEIRLATGYTGSQLNPPSYILEIVGKKPAFL